MFSTDIWIRTPLICSKALSDIADLEVYLKLENAQPSGSFKLRGISHLCLEISQGYRELVGSSGGNAGIALAYTAYKLGVPCHIYVPKFVETRMLMKIQSYGAKVTATAESLQDAIDQAQIKCKNDSCLAYIHPYDDPSLWEGHSYIIGEIKEDLRGRVPSCIVLSVGGGGMLMGTLAGLDCVGWSKIPIVAMETIGADCFYLSVKENRLVEINAKSIAKTLGAKSVAPKLLEKIKEYNIIPHTLNDKDAALSCVRFADDHAIMVEPACGVTLAAVYTKILPSLLENNGFDCKSGPVILIVCGGSDISLQDLNKFATTFE